MSSIKIQSNPNGTGQLILAAPDTNSTRTITLPDADVTLGAGAGTTEAWVNFNGTGTVAIRASGNVSSITDNGTGDYTVNFTSSISDNSYSSYGSAGSQNATLWDRIMSPYQSSSTSCRIRVTASNATISDVSYVSFEVTR